MDEGADICPTEDLVQALLEYLVEPKLPPKSSVRAVPSLTEQESVAKQVHATVILYNYYCRKQNPHLEFLGFENFCKLSVILKPTLLAHLKLMAKSDDTEPDDLEQQLSLTEKKVMDACDISTSLDASRNDPSMHGWPTSKVAIFLVDSKKKNCMLQFGSVVDGVWSMIEKDVDFSGNQSEGSMFSNPINKKKRVIRKPSKEDPLLDGAFYQQLAYSAVKEATGISESDLMVLESQNAFSISKEKAAARFYIMQCTQPNSDSLFQVPIEDAMNSLQGPLVTKNSGRWTHTSVVEYFHLLPYHKLLLDWLSRKGICSSSKIQKLGTEIMDANSLRGKEICCEAGGPKTDGSNLNGFGSKTGPGLPDQNDNRHLGNKDDVNSLEQNANEERCVENTYRGHDRLYKVHMNVTHGVTCSNGNALNVSNVQPVSCQTAVGCLNGLTRGVKIETIDSVARQPVTECRGENSAHQTENHKIISSNQDKMSTIDHAVVTYHPKDLDKLYDFIASKDRELSQASMRVLLSKRDKLSLQLRDIQDQIAQCDKDIETVLSGGDDGLAVKIQSVIEGCNGARLRGANYQPVEEQCSPQSAKRRRVQDTLLNIQTPCQVLDGVCFENDWILPDYQVSPIHGGYIADVTVKGRNFESSINGDKRPNPLEARESAAEKMLTKLRQSCEAFANISCLPLEGRF